MKFELSYLDFENRKSLEDRFSYLDCEYGSVEYCTWGIIKNIYHIDKCDFRDLASRKILAILQRVSKHSILSPSDVDKIVSMCLHNRKRLGSFHLNTRRRIENSLFYPGCALRGAAATGMIKSIPVTFLRGEEHCWVWRAFWNSIEEIKKSKIKKLSQNEIEIGFLLTMLGDLNATAHYRSKNFWRRQKLNIRNNYEYS